MLDHSKVEEEKNNKKEGKKGRLAFWFTILLFVLVAVFLLLLFLPIADTPDTSNIERNLGTLKARLQGSKVVNDAEFKFVSYKFLEQVGPRKPARGVRYIAVELKIRNLSMEPQMLNDTMVMSGETEARKYSMSPTLTEIYYSSQKKRSPWGQIIKSGGGTKATAVFIISSPAKKVILQFYGFDWTKNDSVQLNIGFSDEELPKKSKKDNDGNRAEKTKSI